MSLDPALPPARARHDMLGLAALMRTAYAGRSLQPVWDGLCERVAAEPADAAAWMDMSTVLMLSGRRDQALETQASALALSRVYRRPHGRADGLRVVAFMIAGDLMANTPADFLLEGSDIELWLVYLDEAGRPPAHVPDHDVALMAVGESPDSASVLLGAARALKDWPRPVLNGAAERVAALTRDGVASLFADDPQILAPAVRRLSRTDLAGLNAAAFPVIARPIGSHAGQGLERLDDPAAVGAYLQSREEADFYVSPFVDYAGPDGLFRKQRIVFIGGRAFVAHMAVSEHWMVHYLSAGMAESAEKRAEEAAFMASFDQDFGRRHALAFRSLCDTIGLDYFGIDCAETPDGRLLLFEVDVAMIVHALDPDPPFGYKAPAMRRLFQAFQDTLALSAAGAVGSRPSA